MPRTIEIKDEKSGATEFKYTGNTKIWDTSFQSPPKRTASVWGPVQCYRHTDFLREYSKPLELAIFYLVKGKTFFDVSLNFWLLKNLKSHSPLMQT